MYLITLTETPAQSSVCPQEEAVPAGVLAATLQRQRGDRQRQVTSRGVIYIQHLHDYDGQVRGRSGGGRVAGAGSVLVPGAGGRQRGGGQHQDTVLYCTVLYCTVCRSAPGHTQRTGTGTPTSEGIIIIFVSLSSSSLSSPGTSRAA